MDDIAIVAEDEDEEDEYEDESDSTDSETGENSEKNSSTSFEQQLAQKEESIQKLKTEVDYWVANSN